MKRRSRSRRGSGSQAVALVLVSLILLPACSHGIPHYGFPKPAVGHPPKSYVCYRASEPIAVDGRLDEAAWADAPRTDAFVDIEGDVRPGSALRHAGRDAVGRRRTSTSPPRWRSRTSGRRSRSATRSSSTTTTSRSSSTPTATPTSTTSSRSTRSAPSGTCCSIKPYRDGGTGDRRLGHPGARDRRRTSTARSTIRRDTDDGWTRRDRDPLGGARASARTDPCPPEPGDTWRVNFSRVAVADSRSRTARYVKVDRPRDRRAAARGQLGLVAAGADRHALPGDVGLRPVLDRGRRSGGRDRGPRRDREHDRAGRSAPGLLRRARRSHGDTACYTDDLSRLGASRRRLPTALSWPPAIT